MQDELPPDAVAAVEYARFSDDIRIGLSKAQKAIPCHYFYDAVGSLLFEQITQLDEYYPSRTETGILQACVGEIAARVREGTVLVEFGSGSSVKTDLILAACPAIRIYVPIDVSATMLAHAKSRLEAKFPRLTVEPLERDFTRQSALPSHLSGRPRLGFFPGSTIGNFGHEPAVELLAGFRALLGPESRLIVGADLRKSPDILVPAYNDAAGVTAAFNLNLLARINRELGGNFDLSAFHHDATYDVAEGRIDMWLVSARDQAVTAAGCTFQFAKGERIHTEISQKYSIEELRTLASGAGWEPANVWTDRQNLFSVHAFQNSA